MTGKNDGKTLAEIARQAWLECPLDEDHWEAAAQAVRDAVIEECARAIEETEKELAAEGEVYILVKAAQHMRSLKSKEVSNDAD